MSLKYLNLTGLSRVITNLKNWVVSQIPTKTSEITNDSGFITSSNLPTNHVTTDTTQTISGQKTFTTDTYITSDSNKYLQIKNTSWDLGQATPSSNLEFGGICFKDKDNQNVSYIITYEWTSGYGALRLLYRTKFSNGEKSTSGSNVDSQFTVGVTPDGKAYCGTNGYWHSDLIPTVNNNIVLGNATYRWKAVYSNAYYLGSTAFGDIVTHNASEYSLSSHTHTKSEITDFPTIPTVNNATLTIQKNGTTVKTFTANASSNVTCNITVPTKTSEITNDSGFLTSHQSLSNYSTLANTVKSLSISGKTITVTPGSGSAYTLTTQDTVYTHPTTAGNKHIPSGGAANQYLKYSASGTAVWANLPTIPTKTSELTNDSGYLTSHQSLSGYLPLTGGTVTGATYFTTDYYRKDTGAVKGTAPSASRWQNGVRFVDNNNVAFGGVERGFLSDGTNRINMIVYKGTTTNTSENAQIGVGFDKDGNWFTYSPTPATSDNSTKIATTKWVNAKGYITASSSITGNAANVTGTVAIGHGGTGATTRLGAVKALTEENVGTSTEYFLTITNSWGKAGYCSVANAKTVLGLKSAAYTESSAYAAASHTHSQYLTEHQSLSNYSTKANTVKSLSISGKTITVTPGSGNAYTLTTQDTVYTHPTTAGNKHIPSGGSSGQILKYSSSGTAVWADPKFTREMTQIATRTSVSNGTWTITSVSNQLMLVHLYVEGTSATTQHIVNVSLSSGAYTLVPNNVGLVGLSSSSADIQYNYYFLLWATETSVKIKIANVTSLSTLNFTAYQ